MKFPGHHLPHKGRPVPLAAPSLAEALRGEQGRRCPPCEQPPAPLSPLWLFFFFFLECKFALSMSWQGAPGCRARQEPGRTKSERCLTGTSPLLHPGGLGAPCWVVTLHIFLPTGAGEAEAACPVALGSQLSPSRLRESRLSCGERDPAAFLRRMPSRERWIMVVSFSLCSIIWLNRGFKLRKRGCT